MKLVNQSFEILNQEATLEDAYKQIELAARVCYKSEDNIHEGSAKKMVDRLIQNQHYAMLEHGTIYLTQRIGMSEILNNNIIYQKYSDNYYSKAIDAAIDIDFNSSVYVTTNLRVLVENGWLDDLKYFKLTDNHQLRITVKFVTSIGIVRELLRHRVFSFANESTRYCNYGNGRFNNEITYVIPSRSNLVEGEYRYVDTSSGSHWTHDKHLLMPENKDRIWLEALENAEKSYLHMLDEGFFPQEARGVLPLDTKSELVMTGFIEDWKHVFDLRIDGITGVPHPDIKALLLPVQQEFIKNGWI